MALSVLILAVAGTLVWRTFYRAPQEAPDTIPVMYICAESGKQFPHVRKLGETSPVISPFSGKNTGYTAEKCYWTRDGKITDKPTYILLNEYVGKPGPTLCPDCGRPVVPHNPRPKSANAGEIVIPAIDPDARQTPVSTGAPPDAPTPKTPTTQPAGH